VELDDGEDGDSNAMAMDGNVEWRRRIAINPGMMQR